MYNRYIRNDQGTYTRVPQEEDSSRRQSGPGAPPPPGSPPSPEPGGPPPPPPPHDPPPGGTDGGFSGVLRRLLDQMHLDRIDTGDLLLLGLLFFLFREDADEELLIALGLLLIL